MKKYRLKYDMNDEQGIRVLAGTTIFLNADGRYYDENTNEFTDKYVESMPDLFEPVEEEDNSISHLTSSGSQYRDLLSVMNKINELVDGYKRLSKEVEELKHKDVEDYLLKEELK